MPALRRLGASVAAEAVSSFVPPGEEDRFGQAFSGPACWRHHLALAPVVGGLLEALQVPCVLLHDPGLGTPVAGRISDCRRSQMGARAPNVFQAWSTCAWA